MQVETHTALWLDASQRVSMTQLAELSGLVETELYELVDAGSLVPRDLQELPWMFTGDCVLRARRARRLRDDLELDAHALALTLALLDQVSALQDEVTKLRAQNSLFP